MGGGGVMGPSKFGVPNTPGAAQYINNPSQFTAFNQTPLQNMAMANINANAGNQARLAGSQYNAAGAAGGAGAMNAARDIYAQAQNVGAQSQENAAKESFAQQLAQQNAANQFNLQRQQMLQDQYKTEAGLRLGEEANRQSLISKLPGGDYINAIGGFF